MDGEVRGTSVKGRLVAGYLESSSPADFWFWRPKSEAVDSRFFFRCPCGCGTLSGAKLTGAHAVTLVGYDESPSLQNSDRSPATLEVRGDAGPHWNGYLCDGWFTPA